jgi:hypothetical protein
MQQYNAIEKIIKSLFESTRPSTKGLNAEEINEKKNYLHEKISFTIEGGNLETTTRFSAILNLRNALGLLYETSVPYNNKTQDYRDILLTETHYKENAYSDIVR